MPGTYDSSDDRDDDRDEAMSDRDDPDESDMDPDDDDETLPCPYCQKPVYEKADICPHCHSFISFEDAPARRPLWIWLAVVLILVGMFWWLL